MTHSLYSYVPYYPTVASRFGRLLPGLFDSIMKLRVKEGHQLKQKNDQVSKPHIRNALQQVPSENLAQQKIVQDRMRIALDDMHRQIVDDVSRYIDNKVADIGWLTSPVNIDYIASDIAERIIYKTKTVTNNLETTATANHNYEIFAYDQAQLVSLIKLLTFFAVIDNTGEVPASLANKVADWYDAALPLLTEISVAKAKFKSFDPKNYRQGKLPVTKQAVLRAAMKDMRKTLRVAKVQKGFATSRDYRQQYVRLLNNLYTYFNSQSSNAYAFIVNNIGALGDNDLNALLAPVFSGDIHDETKKLIRLVKKHGGSGHSLTKEQEDDLKERDLEAHKNYRKQRNFVNNGVKIEVKRLIRASGKKLMAANKIKQELIKDNIPTGFIPTGFEKGGQYDELGNMYTAKGVQFNINPVGGWLNWLSGTGDDEKAIAEYQTPGMVKSAGVYSMHHTKVGLQEKKHGHAEYNAEHLPEFSKKWIEDSQSDNPVTELLGNLALILYYTSIRVGGGKTRDGTITYGLTTLQVGHVKRFTDSDGETGVVLDFLGKDAVPLKLKLSPNNATTRRIIAYILKMAEGKPRKARLWQFGHRTTSISPSTIKKYLNGHGWQGSAKTFRTLRGDNMFEELIADAPGRFNSRQNAISYIEGVITKIGSALGHKRTNKTTGRMEDTFQTAAKSYINPNLILEFFHQHQIHPLPPWAAPLEHIAQKQDEDDDED
jgi:hypothetical protein